MAEIITADAPGPTTVNPGVFTHTHSAVPWWPQSEEAAYAPAVVATGAAERSGCARGARL